MKSFWSAALTVAGLAAIGLFVLYKLYGQIIGLSIFAGLSQAQSFTIFLVLVILIFLIAAFSIWIWYLNNKNEHSSASVHLVQTASGIEFEIPRKCTFRAGAMALAQAENATVSFHGFTTEQLNTLLHPRRLTPPSMEIGFRQLGEIAAERIPSYQTTKDAGSYHLTVR